ncbi:hypothetical protein SCUP515_04784 [Seiridium cupressi]
MANTISSFFTSFLPDFRPKPQVSPSQVQGETRVLGSSPAPKTPTTSSPQSPVPSATAAPTARPTAAPVQDPTGVTASSTSSEEVRKQREKFLNERFGNGKSKSKKSTKTVTDTNPTSSEVLAWN